MVVHGVEGVHPWHGERAGDLVRKAQEQNDRRFAQLERDVPDLLQRVAALEAVICGGANLGCRHKPELVPQALCITLTIVCWG